MYEYMEEATSEKTICSAKESLQYMAMLHCKHGYEKENIGLFKTCTTDGLHTIDGLLPGKHLQICDLHFQSS